MRVSAFWAATLAAAAFATAASGVYARTGPGHPADVRDIIVAFGEGYRDVSPPGNSVFGNPDYIRFSTTPEPAALGLCKSDVLTLGFPAGQLPAHRDGSSATPLVVNYWRQTTLYEIVGDTRPDLTPRSDEAFDEAYAIASRDCAERTDGWNFSVEGDSDWSVWVAHRVMTTLAGDVAGSPQPQAGLLTSCRGRDCDAPDPLLADVVRGKLVEVKTYVCRPFSVAEGESLQIRRSTKWDPKCLELVVVAKPESHPEGLAMSLRVRANFSSVEMGDLTLPAEPQVIELGIYEPEPVSFDY